LAPARLFCLCLGNDGAEWEPGARLDVTAGCEFLSGAPTKSLGVGSIVTQPSKADIPDEKLCEMLDNVHCELIPEDCEEEEQSSN
jgi:hypothetical protein